MAEAPDKISRTGAGREFMEKTRHIFSTASDQQRGLPEPPLELPPDPSLPIIELPRPESLSIPPLDLRNAIEHRRSVSRYAQTPVMLEELTFLLWCTQGVQQKSGFWTIRTVPSAGARHAFETYLLVNNVTGLRPGLYRYLALGHLLQQLDTDPSLSPRIAAACLDQQFVLHSAVTFIWTAVPYRMTWRFGERGYRDLHLDAGHVCQNLFLAAEAVGCGVCAIAAFEDDTLNAILKIDGINQFVIYCATAGKKD
jgi:SagB-type dehydrogenase family enzyme